MGHRSQRVVPGRFKEATKARKAMILMYTVYTHKSTELFLYILMYQVNRGDGIRGWMRLLSLASTFCCLCSQWALWILVGFGSGTIFEDFLETEVSKLAQVPIVLAVHAASDQCSSFRDVAALVGEVVDTTNVTFVSCEPLPICFLSCFRIRLKNRKTKHSKMWIRHTKTLHFLVLSLLGWLWDAKVSAIIQKTQDTAWDTWNKWSTAKLVQVPENLANSDHPGKKRPAQWENVWTWAVEEINEAAKHVLACLFLHSKCICVSFVPL